MEIADDRALFTSGTFMAPLTQLWAAWTNPEHIAHWWGPDGFTTSVHTMDFREGGEWKLTLHGPNGTNYPNRSVFKEIVPLQKIVFEHFNPHFTTVVQFVANGTETNIEWTLLFDTKEMRDLVVIAHKADEGQKQNLERLAKYISQQLPTVGE